MLGVYRRRARAALSKLGVVLAARKPPSTAPSVPDGSGHDKPCRSPAVRYVQYVPVGNRAAPLQVPMNATSDGAEARKRGAQRNPLR